MDTQQATLAYFHRDALDILAPTQGQTAIILVAMAMGKCEIGGMWAPLDQRHSPMCAMWNNPWHNST